MTETEFVKVRIAVAVSDLGNIGCCACGELYDDSDALRQAQKETVEGVVVAQAFIEAYIPRIPTVQGCVVAESEES